MTDQLFRFSVLRAPEAPSSLSPIVVVPTDLPGVDRLVPVAQSVAAALKKYVDLGTTNAGQLSMDLDLDPARWHSEEVSGLVTFARSRIARMFHDLSATSSLATRAAFNNAAEFLTAAVLVEELGRLPRETKLGDWITTHPIVLGPGLMTKPWLPRQALVREPSITDHYVVRDELVGYQMGEIEDIKNYLKGELKDHKLRHLTIREEETVDESESDSTRTTELATQQRSSMSSATQTTANSSAGLDARVKTDGQYGPTKVSTDIGFQYASAGSESRQTAAEFSTDVLNRSVEVVRQRELKRVTRRSRTELEENRAHRVDNIKGAEHTIGIYRWVDSVWKATTYAVGLRLVLEFLIPEPGKALHKQPKIVRGPAPEDLPNDLFSTITAQQAASLSQRYGAEGVVAPPVASQIVGAPFSSTVNKDSPDERVMCVVVKDLKVPKDYHSVRAFVSVSGMERGDVNVESNIVIDIPGVRPLIFAGQPGLKNPLLIEGAAGITGRPTPGMHTLMLESTIDIGPEATLPVTVYAEDLRGLAGVAELHCVPTQQAIDLWKLDTIQKITGAYRSRVAEWEAANLAQSFEPPVPVPVPDLDALCRHACISSLLGPGAVSGQAAWPSTANWNEPKEGWPVPGALGNASGELIEFMEQAFEWSNLQYVAYPYYWARSDRWEKLISYDHADPKVREFLRSGAVRMVVPVRFDLTQAVLFFLGTGIPWFGGPAPVPGQPGYLAIADEIKNSRSTRKDEQVIDTFDYTLPTSLTILQPDGVLPAPQ